MPDRYDVLIIGAGPGGYVAAIRAAQLGFKTACIESRSSLGGTCLNIGCIPSKALLQSSGKFAEAGHSLAEHGIKIGDLELDLAAMMARKDKVVTTLTRGVEFLFRKNKVDWLQGKGRIGGRYIGLELGSVWSRLGAKVTVVEYLDRILPNMDRELGPALQRVLTRSGMIFKLATKVVEGRAGNDGVALQLEAAAGGARET